MGKVTSKLQVTVPKAIADAYRIKPGDDIVWVAAGDAIRVHTRRAVTSQATSASARLRLFDSATQRQGTRNRNAPYSTSTRGWTREDLYDRGRSR